MMTTAPVQPTLSPGAAANVAWLHRITANHRRIAEAGARREAAAQARHPGR